MTPQACAPGELVAAGSKLTNVNGIRAILIDEREGP